MDNYNYFFSLDNVETFPGYVASDEAIAKAEVNLSLSFSSEYKTVLKNGIGLIGSHELTGIVPERRLNVVQSTLDEWERNQLIPRDLYLIERVGIDGILIWQSEDGSVFLSAPQQDARKVADSLVSYYCEEEENEGE